MTINNTKATGSSGFHWSIHMKECANQALRIDMPVAGVLGFGMTGSLAYFTILLIPISIPVAASFMFVVLSGVLGGVVAAALSGVGFTNSCMLGRVADELSYESHYNTLIVTAARGLGGTIKYFLTASGPINLGRLGAGFLNNALYGAASKHGDAIICPVLIEMLDSKVGGGNFCDPIGILAGFGVSGLGCFVYAPTDGAIALNMALQDRMCHMDCEVAKEVSYNEIQSCLPVNNVDLPREQSEIIADHNDYDENL